jgi:WD40 repeat protein
MTVVTILGVAGVIWQWREAVYQRGVTAQTLIQLAATARETELAREKEALQRVAAESAREQEAVQRKAADEQRAIAVGALAEAERSLYFNNIDLADREWTANNIGHVDQLLSASPAALRNWEWHYLSRLAHAESASFAAADTPVLAFAVSPDGTEATTISSDLTAARWDLRTRRQIRVTKLDGTPGMDFGRTALSADGRVFTASILRIEKGTLSGESRVWDTVTGRALWTLPYELTEQAFTNYSAMAVSRDGTRLITASPERVAPAPGSMDTPEQVRAALLQAVTQMQSGASQAAAKPMSRLRVWDARTGTPLPAPGVVPGRVSSLTLSPDGSRVIVDTGTRGTAATQVVTFATLNDLQILDVASGKVVATLNHSGSATAAFSPDGQTVAAGMPAGVRVWSSAGGDERWSWTGPGAGALTFSPSGRFIAVGLMDKSIHVLEAATGRALARFTGSTAPIRAITFAGSDADLLSVDAGTMRHYQFLEAAPTRVSAGPADMIAAAGVSSDGRRLVTIDRAGGLRSWDVETGLVLFNSPAPPKAPVNLALLAFQLGPLNSQLLLSGDGQRSAMLKTLVFDVGDGRAELRTELRLTDVTTGKEARLFRTAGGGKETSDPALIRQASQSPRMPMALALDATGNHAALVTMRSGVTPGSDSAKVALIGSEMSLWSTANDRPTATVMLPNTMVSSAQMSPDGRHVAVVTGAYSVAGPVATEYRVYDVGTGRFVAAFRAAKESAPVVFSRDGNLLAAETARNTITIWDLTRGGRALVLPEHATPVTKLAFSPDGTRIASLSAQGITLFDARSGNQLLVLHTTGGPLTTSEFIAPGKFSGTVTTLRFSADGRQIIQTTIGNDPAGIKVQFRTWDGSPQAKR